MERKQVVRLSFIDEFSGGAAKFKRHLDEVNASIKAKSDALKELKSQSRALETFDKLTDKASVTAAALRAAKQDVERFSKNLRASKGECLDTAAALSKAQASVVKLSAAHKNQKKQLDSLTSKLTASGHKVDDFASAQRQVAASVEVANSALSAQKQRLKDVVAARELSEKRRAVGREALQTGRRVAVAAGAAYAPAVYYAMDFETAFMGVEKSARGANTDDLAALKQRILTESAALGMAPSMLADVIADVAKNSVDKSQLFNYAAFSARMSTAFDMDNPKAAVEASMRWRAAMGLNLESLIKLGDTINYVADGMSTTPKRVVDIITRKGADLLSAGFSRAEAVALASAVDAFSPTTDISATALKNISIALTKNSAMTEDQRRVLDALGFDPKQLAVDMQHDARATIFEVLKSFKNVDSTDRTGYIADFFGVETFSAINPLLNNLSNVQRSFDLIDQADLQGSMQREFDKKVETAAFKLSALKSALKSLAVTTGDELLPVIKSATDSVRAGIEGLRAFVSGSQAAATAIVAVPAALAAGAVVWKLSALRRLKSSANEVTSKKKESLASRTLSVVARSASKAVDRLSGSLSGLRERYRGDAGDSSARGKKKRRGRRGRLLKRLGFGATALGFGALASSSAEAGTLSDIGLAADAALDISSALGSAGRVVSKVARPVAAIASIGELAAAAKTGDKVAVAASVGELAGGAGGALAGGLAGAAIGSVVPIIGTAVGGAIGSLLGGIGGEFGGGWLGEKLGHFFTDKNLSETHVRARAPQNIQVDFSPTINLTASGDPDNDARLAAEVEKLVGKVKDDLLSQLTDIERYRLGDA